MGLQKRVFTLSSDNPSPSARNNILVEKTESYKLVISLKMRQILTVESRICETTTSSERMT